MFKSRPAWLIIGATALAFVCLGSSCGSPANPIGGGDTTGTDNTGTDNTGTDNTTGALSIAATDAPSPDITSFVVNITSIDLTKANGAQASVLPQTTAIDFADAHNLADLLCSAQVPVGNYVAMTLNLDFSTAVVELSDGRSTSAGTVALTDQDGNPLTGALAVSVDFSHAHPLVIAPGLPAHLLIDFNLDASLDITAGASSDTVVVNPAFEADTQLTHPLVTRIWGDLKSTDAAAGTFDLDIHPFHPAVAGTVTIATTASTTWDGDDLNSDAAVNLADLALEPANTGLYVEGAFDKTAGHFVASEVHFGTDFAIGARDLGEGLVTAISGTTYTVLGRALTRSTGAVTFNTPIAATIDATTVIRQKGATTNLAPAHIGVGQRLFLSGTLAGSGANLTLDCTSAASGTARLLETQVDGLLRTTATPGAGPLTMVVQRIGARPIARFNFSGSVVAVNPANFVVDTHSIDLTGMTGDNTAPFTTADPIGVRGLFAPAGTTGVPTANFDANSVIDRTDVSALVYAHWQTPGSASPFTAATAFPLTLNLTHTNIATVLRAATLAQLTGSPTITLPATPLGPFTLREGNTVTVYDGDEAQSWLDDVNTRLAQGKTAVRFTAEGRFASNSLAANAIELQLK